MLKAPQTVAVLPARKIIALAVVYGLFATPAGLRAQSASSTPSSNTASIVVFGPQTFARTGDRPNRYEATFSVPSNVVLPFLVHVQNGAPDGSNQVSEGSISINGARVIGPRDFIQCARKDDDDDDDRRDDDDHGDKKSDSGHDQDHDKDKSHDQDNHHDRDQQNHDDDDHRCHVAPSIDRWVVSLEAQNKLRIRLSGEKPGFVAVTISGQDIHSRFQFFGPQSYTRARDQRRFTTDLPVPAWIVAPFVLRVQNGDSSGNHQTRHAEISLNQRRVIDTRDFIVCKRVPDGDDANADNNDQDDQPGNGDRDDEDDSDRRCSPAMVINRVVTLNPDNTLEVRLSGRDGSEISVTAIGQNADHTPPVITLAAPVPSGFINNPTPSISLSYNDPVGAGEPAASGVDPTTLKVTVDGVDRTSLFTAQAGSASAAWPQTLAFTEGFHTISASVNDHAGNTGQVTATFGVDLTPPQIAPVFSPLPNAAGWNNTNVTVSFTCTDNLSGVATCPPPITVSQEGAGQTFTVQAADRAGNIATQKVVVNLDKTPPVISATPSVPANAAAWNNTDVTVTFTCSDNLSGVATCPAPQVVSSEGKNQVITGTALDIAGNSATASVTLNIDKTPPTFVATLTPPANAAGWDNTNVTVSFTCADNLSGVATCPAPSVISTEGNGQVVSGLVADVAGNTTTASAIVSIDKTPPLISASVAPGPNSAGWNNTDVTISYVCSDALSGVAICPQPNTVSSEGAAQNISAQATDQAGNSASVSTVLNIDKTPPTITVTSAPPPNAANWNNTNVTVSFACADNLSGVASCPSPQVVSSEGENQNISGQATDVAGNTATGSIILNIDKTPPTIVQFSTPDHISKLHPGQVSVIATDNFTVAQVVISVNGTPLGTFTTPPYQAALQVPAGANPGDTLTVTVVATDQAGNSQTASRGVSVVADGVIVGQVLSDTTSFPAPGASVQMISTTGQTAQTDDKGRYSFQANDSHVFLSATSPASTTVEREIFVQPGAGTVAVDARLTPLAAATSIGSAGGTLTASPVSITVPAASVADGTSFQLTPLSAQGLPGLLPLGWSPLAAFDVRASASFSNLAASVSQLPNVVMQLVTYNPAMHAWTVVAANLQPASGITNFTIPGAGDYALAVPDTTTPPIPIPSIGGALTGVALQNLDPAVTGSVSLNPAALPAGGGTSVATVNLQSPSFAPSGTIVQANVSEKFSLASGAVVSEETRSEDIVFNNGTSSASGSMSAQFPVTPSHTYTNAQLLTGNIHLDILAGREGVRGQPGGNDPVTVTDGTSALMVPGGALSQDTAISVQSTALEDFVPTSSTLSALQEILVDFSGESLNTPAQLSISSSGLNPSDTFLLTEVQRVNGVPHMVAVALAKINGANLISVASPGLPGVIQGGEYVFYDIAAPTGLVQGVAASLSGPVQALVSTDSLPIVSITGANGQYIVPALAGTVNLKAGGTTSSIAGTASTQLAAGQTATVNIQLTGVVSTATVFPADQSLGVDPSTIITVTSPVPLNPQSIAQGNLSLAQGTPSAPGAAVSLQPFTLSASGTVLTFAPAQNLAAATQYTIQVSGLADLGGGAVVVPTSTFTTKASQALNFDPNQITFAFPDQNGNIHVSAPAGSLAPGSTVLIVDQPNAVVLSLTALNDGSVSGDFPGTINDVLQVTVTDPSGATVTFTRSQFVAADGSVAVGPGGGTVTGPGGVELRIPEGALDQGVTFKIAAFGPDLFPERPDVPGGTFGGGLSITALQPANFKKEAKLAFPMPPDAPPGAFFQVFRRLQVSSTEVAFEDLDYALPEGQGPTAKVVTASFPFRGLIDLNMLLDQADYQGQLLDTVFSVPPVAELGLQADAFIIWTVDNSLPGVSLGGTVTGRVRYAVPPGGAMPDGTVNKTGDTVFVGVPNVLVTVDSNPPSHAVINGDTGATTQPDGTFTFSDPHYNGGTINLIAYDGNGHAVTASAIEAVALTDETVNEFAGPLLKFYRNVAFADIVVPAPAPPPPTPQIGISFFTENPNSNPPGLRVPVNGVITSGTSLVIAFKTNGQITNPPNVTINEVPYATQADQPTVAADPNQLDFELTTPFTPSTPGIYNLTVSGLTAFAQPISASRSFLVVAPGGSNNTINVGVPPQIVDVSPVAGATGVPVDTFVQVTFSEPVTNLAGHVSLVPADGSAPPPLRLSGFSYLDTTDSNFITKLSATDAVSSMTIQPLAGLKFNTQYTLQVTSDVVDLDNVADPTKPALALVQPQSPYNFTTFGPQVLGGTPAFSSTRPAVMGDRAYVAIPAALSQVKTFDISDPTNPVEIPASTSAFIGRAFDLAGEENASVIGGGNLLAVIAGFASEDILVPSNLWLYNVSGDQMTRVAGISVTSSSVNVGQGTRVALDGNFAYVAVDPVGIEVVDMQQGINDYNNVFATNPQQFGQGITTDGQGFANDAVVNTIPVQDSAGRNVTLQGIQAGKFVVPGSDPQNPVTQTFVVATGIDAGTTSPNPISFVVADPSQPGTSAAVYATQPKLGGSTLTAGIALALGQLTDSIPDANGNPVVKPVAVVVGQGSAPDPNNPGQVITGGVLAVEDMTNPSAPVVLSMIALPVDPTDVVLHDTTALVGTFQNEVLLVNLIDPRNPVNAGAISGSAFGDKLALTDSGFLLGTSIYLNSGGIRVAELDAPLFIASLDPPLPLLDNNGKTITPVTVEYGVGPDGSLLSNGQLTVLDGDSPAIAIAVPDLTPGLHQVTIPSGVQLSVPSHSVEISLVKPDGSLTEPYVADVSPSTAAASAQQEQTLETLLPTQADNTFGTFAPGSLNPAFVAAGSPATDVTISGVGFTSRQSVFLRSSTSSWTQIPLTVQSDSAGTFTIPASFLAAPDFLEVSLQASDIGALAFLVSDPTLPAPGSDPTTDFATIDSVSPNPLLGSDTIDVTGAGFLPGMKLVLGRSGIPGVVLNTAAISDTELSAQDGNLVLGYADDLEVFILSADGTKLTTGYLLTSGQEFNDIQDVGDVPDPEPNNPAAATGAGEVAVASVSGQFSRLVLPPSVPSTNHTFTIEGVNLQNGMQVQFLSRRSATETIRETQPLTGVMVLPDPLQAQDQSAVNQHAQGTVTVTDAVLRSKQASLRLTANKKGASQETMAQRVFDDQKAVTGIPFAGRIQLQLFVSQSGSLTIYSPQLDGSAPANSAAVARQDSSIKLVENAPFARVESEDSDPTYWYVRGLHLTLMPPSSDPNNRMPVDTTNPAAGFRQPVEILMSKDASAADCNAKDAVCRTFEVVYRHLGNGRNEHDQDIVLAADTQNIPPQFLKAQFLQETGLFSTNFRYEPSTSDFATLTGDLGNRIDQNANVVPYLVAGHEVGKGSQQTTRFRSGDGGGANHNVFTLPVQSIRRASTQPPLFFGDTTREACYAPTPTTQRCALTASITTVDDTGQLVPGTTQQNLTAVWPVATWRKCSFTWVKNKAGRWVPQRGCQSNGVAVTAVPTLATNQFSADYVNGTITLWRPLQDGTRTDPVTNKVANTHEQLNVNFSTFSSVQVHNSPGAFIANAPAFDSTTVGGTGKLVRPFPVIVNGKHVFLQYTPGQPLCNFFNLNLQNDPTGKFLLGTNSDSALEFNVDQATGSLPVFVRDQRYCAADSQPYAASSYGVSQVLPRIWTGPHGADFSAILDITTTPIFTLLTDFKTGMNLGARFHVNTMQDRHIDCSQTSNELAYEVCWSNVIRFYNSTGQGYTLDGSQRNNIVETGAACYTPRIGQDAAPSTCH